MKNDRKILIGLSAIVTLVFTNGLISYYLQNRIIEDTRQIKDVEAPLELMVEEVIGYDAMLTGNAHQSLLSAMKGNMTGFAFDKEEYDVIGTKLNDLLNIDAKILLEKSERTEEQKNKVKYYLQELERINVKLVDLETRAFEAMEKNDTDTAYSLIVSENYRNYKKELYQKYVDWGNAEKEVTLDIRNNILKQSQLIVLVNLGLSTICVILLILTTGIIRRFFMELIINKNKKTGNLSK